MVRLIQDCIEEYENKNGFTPRNVTISWHLFNQEMERRFIKEWHDTMKFNDLAIITDIGMTNIWVDKNQKESIVVG